MTQTPGPVPASASPAVHVAADLNEPLVVAIDGPSGSGKSTVSRAVARRLGLRYLDTGAMYRAVTWAVLERGIGLADVDAAGRAAEEMVLSIDTDPDGTAVAVDGVDVSVPIRGQRVTAAVSAVSAVPRVRTFLLERQRELIDVGGIVVEGRDIGTVVAPGAALKVFLTADPAVRALRRSAELDGSTATTTQAELAQRDATDAGRAVAPLAQAADAVVVDATDRTADEVVEHVLALVADLARGRS